MVIGGQEHSAARRRDILAAARKVFGDGGYEAATMDDVAAQAGVAKGSLYNYFPSKQELFKQLFLEDQTILDYQAMLEADLPASRKLENMLDLWFAQLAEHKRTNRLVLEYWATAAREEREGEMTATFQRVYSQWHELAMRLIEQGVAAGEFNAGLEPAMAASLIMALVDGVNTEAMLNVGAAVDEKLLAAIKKAILAGLRNATAGPSGAPRE
jgi:AcrR family transcriptional regulator